MDMWLAAPGNELGFSGCLAVTPIPTANVVTIGMDVPGPKSGNPPSYSLRGAASPTPSMCSVVRDWMSLFVGWRVLPTAAMTRPVYLTTAGIASHAA